MSLKKSIFFIIIFFASVLASRDLFRAGYFPMHDDLQIGRLYQMDLCFRDGQIPCRWVPDMGYGYGYPLFNFYPPFPYYLGQLFHFLGLSYIDSTKLLFFTGFLVSGILMFFLGKKFWGDWGGLLSGTLYIWAPYHSVDVYVRGAMNEFWAIAFLPGIFWAAYELIDTGEKKIFLPLFSFFFGMLLLSHNLMALIFTPALVVFILLLIWLKKKNLKNNLISFSSAGVLGFGLAAFFTIPVLLEKNYVHVETMLMGYFNYLAHYVSVGKMLFTRFWGYGSSGWLQETGMPFQVGFPHWPLAVLVLILSATAFIKKKISKETVVLAAYFFLLFLFSLFLIHPRSVFIWDKVSLLAYLQFPWRFLTLVIFALSVLGGGIAIFIKENQKKAFVSVFLIILTIALNFSFFKPEKIIEISDTEKLFSAVGWNKLQTDAIFDYLPIYAKAPPAKPAPEKPVVVEGEAEIYEINKGTNWYSFVVNGRESIIQIPIYYFPGWKATVNGEQADINYDNHLGLITLNLGEGEHQVFAKLFNTPVRTAANLFSAFSWLALFFLLVKNRSLLKRK